MCGLFICLENNKFSLSWSHSKLMKTQPNIYTVAWTKFYTGTNRTVFVMMWSLIKLTYWFVIHSNKIYDNYIAWLSRDSITCIQSGYYKVTKNRIDPFSCVWMLYLLNKIIKSPMVLSQRAVIDSASFVLVFFNLRPICRPVL